MELHRGHKRGRPVSEPPSLFGVSTTTRTPTSAPSLFETTHPVTAEYVLEDQPISSNTKLRCRVYRARHRTTGAVVAIKETWYNPHDTRSLQVAKLEAGMMIRYATRLSASEASHLVRFTKLYHDTTTRRYWIVMPWLAGTLHDKIVNSLPAPRLDEAEAQRLFAQLVHAVHGLHKAGIVHRDIKPANVLMTGMGSDGNAVLADFGLAAPGAPVGGSAATVADVFHNQRVGTLEWMSPEQLAARPTFASDIWSLGVVLYAMLSGRSPWCVQDPAGVAQAIQRGEYCVRRRDFPGVSKQAKRLIHMCMQMQPQARPTAAELLDRPWVREGLARTVYTPPAAAIATTTPSSPLLVSAPAPAPAPAVAPASAPVAPMTTVSTDDVIMARASGVSNTASLSARTISSILMLPSTTASADATEVAVAVVTTRPSSHDAVENMDDDVMSVASSILDDNNDGAHAVDAVLHGKNGMWGAAARPSNVTTRSLGNGNRLSSSLLSQAASSGVSTVSCSSSRRVLARLTSKQIRANLWTRGPAAAA